MYLCLRLYGWYDAIPVPAKTTVGTVSILVRVFKVLAKQSDHLTNRSAHYVRSTSLVPKLVMANKCFPRPSISSDGSLPFKVSLLKHAHL